MLKIHDDEPYKRNDRHSRGLEAGVFSNEL